MVTEKIFVNTSLAAGATSPGVKVELAEIRSIGFFGLEVSCSAPVELTYRAAAEGNTPGSVSGGGVLCSHTGGGRMCYAVDIIPMAVVWIYATAPSGTAVSGLNVTLSVW